MRIEQPWYAKYPEGVAETVSPYAFENLVDLITHGSHEYASQSAYRYMDRSYTFEQIDAMARDFGAYLQSLGLTKGDKIILQMPNMPQMPIAIFGALKAGLTVVNTNPLYTPREMKHQYLDSEAKAVVILSNFAHNLEKIIQDTQIEHIIITEVGDMLGGLKRSLVNFVVKNIQGKVPKYNLPEAVKFRKALFDGAQSTLTDMKIHNDDTAFIQYTGGTTGVSKGAELSHGNIIANVEGIREWFNPASNELIERKVLGALPLYHIFALTVNVFTGLRLGFDNILIINPRDQKSLLKDLRKHKFFIFPGINTLFNALVENPKFQKINFENLRITIAGGMALQKHVADRWEQLTGCRITEGYGLSETSPVASCNPVDGTQVIGTIGIPFPSTDMRILQDDLSWAGPEEEGEICICGPQVMKGYYNREEETEETFITHEGKRYLKTGDIGCMLLDGYFRIVDRKKDMINVSGFNVYPNEIEEVISAMPGISEVAAIGVPDPSTHEAVKVYAVKSDPEVTVQQVRDYSKENLTNYKRPKYIEFREELPKTNVGKILRRALKEDVAAHS